MVDAIEMVKGERNGIDVWPKFRRFGWGIVEVISALVGGLADVLDWIHGGRHPIDVPLRPEVPVEEEPRPDPHFLHRVVEDVQWQG